MICRAGEPPGLEENHQAVRTPEVTPVWADIQKHFWGVVFGAPGTSARCQGVANGKAECWFNREHRAGDAQFTQSVCDNKGRKQTVTPVAKESLNEILEKETGRR